MPRPFGRHFLALRLALKLEHVTGFEPAFPFGLDVRSVRGVRCRHTCKLTNPSTSISHGLNGSAGDSRCSSACSYVLHRARPVAYRKVAAGTRDQAGYPPLLKWWTNWESNPDFLLRRQMPYPLDYSSVSFYPAPFIPNWGDRWELNPQKVSFTGCRDIPIVTTTTLCAVFSRRLNFGRGGGGRIPTSSFGDCHAASYITPLKQNASQLSGGC